MKVTASEIAVNSTVCPTFSLDNNKKTLMLRITGPLEAESTHKGSVMRKSTLHVKKRVILFIWQCSFWPETIMKFLLTREYIHRGLPLHIKFHINQLRSIKIPTERGSIRKLIKQCLKIDASMRNKHKQIHTCLFYCDVYIILPQIEIHKTFLEIMHGYWQKWRDYVS